MDLEERTCKYIDIFEYEYIHMPWKSTTILKMVKLLLEDDEPYYKEWWFGNQPIKNGGQGLPAQVYLPGDSN